MIGKKKYLLFIIFIVSVNLFSKERMNIDLPVDEKKEWVIGVSTLSGDNLPVEYSYLLSSIPLLILEQLSSCKDHVLSKNEIKKTRENLIEEKTALYGKNLAKLYQERDDYIFEKKVEKAKYKEINKKIKALEKQISSLRQADITGISISDEKPISFKMASEGNVLLDPFEISPERFSRSNSLDLLIYGNVEEIDEYIFFELFIYNSIMDKTVFSLQKAVRSDRVDLIISSLRPKIVSIVLGREWADLRVLASWDEEISRQAEIYVNDEFYGYGDITAKLLIPGEQKIKVIAEGYKNEYFTKKINPFEEGLLEISLKKVPVKKIAVTSYPLDADIYLGSKWLGKTPLIINRPENVKQLTIKKDMYQDYTLYLSGLTGSVKKIYLSPALFDKDKYIKKKRSRFYTSLGLFFISIPYSMIMYDLATDYNSAYVRAVASGNPDDARKKRRANIACYNAYISGLFLSGALCINALIDLTEYVNVATDKKTIDQPGE